jgi:hypothetical protein
MQCLFLFALVCALLLTQGGDGKVRGEDVRTMEEAMGRTAQPSSKLRSSFKYAFRLSETFWSRPCFVLHPKYILVNCIMCHQYCFVSHNKAVLFFNSLWYKCKIEGGIKDNIKIRRRYPPIAHWGVY